MRSPLIAFIAGKTAAGKPAAALAVRAIFRLDLWLCVSVLVAAAGFAVWAWMMGAKARTISKHKR
jgi:hypothetical protein